MGSIHDLRTPLNSIMGFTQIVIEKLGSKHDLVVRYL